MACHLLFIGLFLICLQQKYRLHKLQNENTENYVAGRLRLCTISSLDFQISLMNVETIWVLCTFQSSSKEIIGIFFPLKIQVKIDIPSLQLRILLLYLLENVSIYSMWPFKDMVALWFLALGRVLWCTLAFSGLCLGFWVFFLSFLFGGEGCLFVVLLLVCFVV